MLVTDGWKNLAPGTSSSLREINWCTVVLLYGYYTVVIVVTIILTLFKTRESVKLLILRGEVTIKSDNKLNLKWYNINQVINIQNHVEVIKTVKYKHFFFCKGVQIKNSIKKEEWHLYKNYAYIQGLDCVFLI